MITNKKGERLIMENEIDRQESCTRRKKQPCELCTELTKQLLTHAYDLSITMPVCGICYGKMLLKIKAALDVTIPAFNMIGHKALRVLVFEYASKEANKVIGEY